ncbi:hypothetical protein B0A52_04686 [Exophiala mesophila]|uniref:Amino acid transporter transmembrane domain-containing protein n=1 Tax=Exophiala mesophila TaxID=212818 RepID=A0A438N932_EXOME|nr:hypothetical protein B0A52_04686 [Exophiala mesophila]
MNPDYWKEEDEEKTIGWRDRHRSNDDDPIRGSVQKATDPAYEPATGTVKPVGNLGPYQAAVIFITNEIGIGILSLPAALQVLGLIPGVIAIVGMGSLSLYTAYILVQFYRRYPHVVNMVDFGRVLGGRPLEFVFAVGFTINLALICASAIITISIGLNTITEHAMCTVAFIAFPAILCFLLCVPRTMKFVSYCGWPCTVSIVTAVLIPMIALGIGGPANVPDGEEVTFKIVGDPSFSEAVSAFLNIGFAFSGNQAFVTVLAEMRDPARDFTKAICIEKIFAIIMYSTVAIVCYVFAGDYVQSPAIGSAPVTIAKISYGIIFVSLFGTGLVFGHTVIKYLFVFTMRHLAFVAKRRGRAPSVEANAMKRRQSQPHDSRSRTSWIVWIAIGAGYWILVFIIANAIPVFDSLLNISASLLLAWFTWGLPSVFWIHLNWNHLFDGWKKTALFCFNIFILGVTLFMNTAGMYASIDSLLSTFADPDNNVDGPFTCGDNSIF